ncbi:hypothetical protein ARD30_19180 [Bosea thiooxidans]|uniref:RAG2 PHD domain containing protein n=2 Tax=Bosea thiooxidans TaxID=53254 RepID=A0A0Q3KHL1_9HYPH|nr:hypothetical protein ARD30_19180 [Bosea thiooxidans]SKB99809.1 hypothetical protein SAMN05660750_03521 [Bosea thiooxidans]
MMFSIPRKAFGGPLRFLVGRDSEGHWLAVETHGRGGGIFADRGAALRYAVFETGHRPRAVRMTAKTLRLL